MTLNMSLVFMFADFGRYRQQRPPLGISLWGSQQSVLANSMAGLQEQAPEIMGHWAHSLNYVSRVYSVPHIT